MARGGFQQPSCKYSQANLRDDLTGQPKDVGLSESQGTRSTQLEFDIWYFSAVQTIEEPSCTDDWSPEGVITRFVQNALCHAWVKCK